MKKIIGIEYYSPVVCFPPSCSIMAICHSAEGLCLHLNPSQFQVVIKCGLAWTVP